MKKKSLLILLLGGIISIVLAGCHAGKEEIDFEKTQKIEILSAENAEVIATFSEDEDIENFVDALKMEEWDSVTIPSGAVEGEIIKMYRKDVAKLSFSKKNGLNEVATMTTYNDYSYIKFEWKKLSFSFKVPEDAQNYFKSLEI